jgi:hypothetical protein
VRLLFAIGAIAAAIAAALVALSARDLRRTWTWPDEMDAVQPSDPWPPRARRAANTIEVMQANAGADAAMAESWSYTSPKHEQRRAGDR